MRRMKRLADLTNAERLLLLRALFAVGLARLALWVLPVATALRVVTTLAGITGETPVERFVWAVRLVSRYLPRATCLTQAIALHALLARAGHGSRIEIGIAKDVGCFLAHAWVICENQ